MAKMPITAFTHSKSYKKMLIVRCKMSTSCMQASSTMPVISIHYKERLTAKYMLVTPYMMIKIFASVNFLKQKYKPAVTTKKTHQ